MSCSCWHCMDSDTKLAIMRDRESRADMEAQIEEYQLEQLTHGRLVDNISAIQDLDLEVLPCPVCGTLAELYSTHTCLPDHAP